MKYKKRLYFLIVVFFSLLFLKDYFFLENDFKQRSEFVVKKIEEKEKQVLGERDKNDFIFPLPIKQTNDDAKNDAKDDAKEVVSPDYYFFDVEIDLEKFRRENLVSKREFSNETMSRIKQLKEKIFLEEELFEYDDEVYEKILNIE